MSNSCPQPLWTPLGLSPRQSETHAHEQMCWSEARGCRPCDCGDSPSGETQLTPAARQLARLPSQTRENGRETACRSQGCGANSSSHGAIGPLTALLRWFPKVFCRGWYGFVQVAGAAAGRGVSLTQGVSGLPEIFRTRLLGFFRLLLVIPGEMRGPRWESCTPDPSGACVDYRTIRSTGQ